MDTKNEESKPVSGNSVEPEVAVALRGKPANGADAESSLGHFLSAARERRGVSREQVANQTGIPKRYLQMMENNDYSLASDQLYVLPFMRRYATFLALDPEETAMRFVREVQRAENNPGSRIDEPLDVDKSRRKSGGWIGIVAVVVVIAIAGLLYMTESGRHSSDNTAPTAVVTSIPAAPAAASTTVSPAAPASAAVNANAGGMAPGGASTTMRSGTAAANQHP
jgi:transcriptional regulator with XRE-family HTH domain